MNDINKMLDTYARKERVKAFSITLLILIITVPVLAWLSLPPLGPVSEVSGVIRTLTGMASDEGEKSYIVVEIKNGEQVKSRISNVSLYKKGKVVSLSTHEPLLFGKATYHFKRYTD